MTSQTGVQFFYFNIVYVQNQFFKKVPQLHQPEKKNK